MRSSGLRRADVARPLRVARKDRVVSKASSLVEPLTGWPPPPAILVLLVIFA